MSEDVAAALANASVENKLTSRPMSAAGARWVKAGAHARTQSKGFWATAKAAKLAEAARIAARVAAEDTSDPLACEVADGKFQTKVVGLCGMSCSGKSTVTAVIKANAQQQGCSVPVICLDDSFSEWMFDDCAESFRDHPECVLTPAHVTPPDRRSWKNWEAKHCIDWPTFRTVLRDEIAKHRGSVPYIIVEGFLLLEDDASCAMLDDCICIGVSKEVAWQRRLSRAIAMAKGEKDASGMDNYEVREDAAAEVEKLGPALIYPHASDAHAKTTDDTLAGAKSTYDWLRLYFEEVIWPFAESVAKRVEAQVGADQPLRVHKVDGDEPVEAVTRATRKIMSAARQA